MKIERELKEQGFTDSDLRHLKKILSRVHNNQCTLSSLLIDLSKRFWAGILGMLAMIFLAILGAVYDSGENTYAYIIVIGFVMLLIYFMIPMKLAWKARKYVASKK